jgi:hypothetical protein
MGSDFAKGTQETLQECCCQLMASTIAARVSLFGRIGSLVKDDAQEKHSVQSEDQASFRRRFI